MNPGLSLTQSASRGKIMKFSDVFRKTPLSQLIDDIRRYPVSNGSQELSLQYISVMSCVVLQNGKREIPCQKRMMSCLAFLFFFFTFEFGRFFRRFQKFLSLMTDFLFCFFEFMCCPSHDTGQFRNAFRTENRKDEDTD